MKDNDSQQAALEQIRATKALQQQAPEQLTKQVLEQSQSRRARENMPQAAVGLSSQGEMGMSPAAAAVPHPALKGQRYQGAADRNVTDNARLNSNAEKALQNRLENKLQHQARPSAAPKARPAGM